MNLPKEEYIRVEENGHTITYCTLRQKVLHTIGLNSGHVGRRLYTRHGKKYYKPFRNYFYGNDADLDGLVDAGYMECREEISHGKKIKTYWLTRIGLDWVGEQIGVHIYNEEN